MESTILFIQNINGDGTDAKVTALLERGLIWQALDLSTVDRRFIVSRSFRLCDVARQALRSCSRASTKPAATINLVTRSEMI